jgi:hypothetical protein
MEGDEFGDQLGVEGSVRGAMTDKILLYPELETWLRRATEDLIPEAAAAVREEIVRHFEDAVRAGIASGIPESKAIDLALRDLGSSRRARRRLLKQHPTVAELQAVFKDVERRNSMIPEKIAYPAMVGVVIGFWSICVLALLCVNGDPGTMNLGLAAVLPVLLSAGIARVLIRRSMEWFIVFQSIVMNLAILGVWIPMTATETLQLQSRGESPLPSWINTIAATLAVTAAIAVWIAYRAYALIRRWRKCRQAARRLDWNPFPG